RPRVGQVQVDVALTDEVAEPHFGDRAPAQIHTVSDGEGDLGQAVIGDVDAVDGADLDAGHAYLIAVMQAGDIGEYGGVFIGSASHAIADRSGQHGRGQHRHDGEHDTLG